MRSREADLPAPSMTKKHAEMTLQMMQPARYTAPRVWSVSNPAALTPSSRSVGGCGIYKVPRNSQRTPNCVGLPGLIGKVDHVQRNDQQAAGNHKAAQERDEVDKPDHNR